LCSQDACTPSISIRRKTPEEVQQEAEESEALKSGGELLALANEEVCKVR
jgi:hypothetical protein